MEDEGAITAEWCSHPEISIELARFFADNVTPEYISHSELQGDRALDVGKWRPGLVGIVAKEIESRIRQGRGTITPAGDSFPIFAAWQHGLVVSMGMVSFFLSAPIPYTIIEDIVVAKERRGSGVGKKLIQWIVSETAKVGCKRLFLESGLNNHQAHEFFEREGFSPCSVIMMKTI